MVPKTRGKSEMLLTRKLYTNPKRWSLMKLARAVLKNDENRSQIANCLSERM
jgi:hypothetical protein